MYEKAKTGWLWLGLCLWGLLAGFSPAAGGPPAGARPLTVAAAADLQFAFTELGARFEQETGKKVVFTFGSTGNLARQIENGAPVDLFAAANLQFVENLMSQGLLIPGTQQVYAIGRIVLASNRQTGLRLHDLKDLLRPEVKRVALANPQHAPYGMAARQALESLGIWASLKPKLVYGENVRQALQYVQTGNVEAGIVALSIANVPEVTYTLIDDRWHQPLKQALAVVKGTQDEAMARRFVAFINGPKGRPVMKRYGFLLPEER
ncbi:MAG: molybdate ABC transporter substrate-binding protein [Deltaproteobacteria bacterium]|nr:molybdate ABC transporter substrate-binding protein [Deltaproteobacteria bacterium]